MKLRLLRKPDGEPHTMRVCIALIIVTLCCACEKTVINRGYEITMTEFNKVRIGRDNAQQVFELLGSPTVRSTVVGEDGTYSWYYVSKKAEKNGFMEPKVVEQETMIITFNANDIVKSVSRGTGEQLVTTVKEQTKTGGKTGGIVSEALGGLGKYRKQFEEKGKSGN